MLHSSLRRDSWHFNSVPWSECSSWGVPNRVVFPLTFYTYTFIISGVPSCQMVCISLIYIDQLVLCRTGDHEPFQLHPFSMEGHHST